MTDFTLLVKCEACPNIFSRKKCLHGNCIGHKADLARYQKEIDDQIHIIVAEALRERGSNPPEIQNKAVSQNILSMQNEAKYGAGNTFLSNIIPPHSPCADYNYFVAPVFPHLLGFPPTLLFDDKFHSHGSLPGCLAEVAGHSLHHPL